MPSVEPRGPTGRTTLPSRRAPPRDHLADQDASRPCPGQEQPNTERLPPVVSSSPLTPRGPFRIPAPSRREYAAGMTGRRERALLVGLVAGGGYGALLRPRLRRWGATDAEVAAPYPGAHLVPGGNRGATSGNAWFEVAALEPQRFLALRAPLDLGRQARPFDPAGPRPRVLPLRPT
jgi:hypothetical protein